MTVKTGFYAMVWPFLGREQAFVELVFRRVMAILHISSVIHVTYHYLVTKRGNTSGSEIVWTYLVSPASVSMIPGD